VFRPNARRFCDIPFPTDRPHQRLRAINGQDSPLAAKSPQNNQHVFRCPLKAAR